MHLDPLLLPTVIVVCAILATGVLMRCLRQPFVVGCLAAGLLLGPEVFGVLHDVGRVGRLGAVGAYQTTVSTIIVTLAVSPAWVALFRRLAAR